MDKLKVLFVSPEVVPFAKTGGLADVAGSLPLALKRLGMDVRIVMPYYRVIREKQRTAKVIINDLDVNFNDSDIKCDVLESVIDKNLPVYYIKKDDFFDRTGLYGDTKGDYTDNLERFSFFSHAILRLAQTLSFLPDIIHCHDWQTGLIPALLKGPCNSITTSTVFTIHNVGYQGLFSSSGLFLTGLSYDDFYHISGLEYWGKISLLKAGINYSDAVTTVSPTYAKEIQTADFGMGMEGVLQNRHESLYGILNGVDYDVWNPETDSIIPMQYSIEKISGKRECKNSLLKMMKLNIRLIDRPLLGIVSRLDSQKGLDILIRTIDAITSLDVGLIILGTGDRQMESDLKRAAGSSPERIAVHIGFDDVLAHRIMAGADIFVIPSRYEPCGLTQMYALKYGTVPVVRATGGLNDTVIQFDRDTGNGNGFKFGTYDSNSLLNSINQAVELYSTDSKQWEKLMNNGMKADFSWDRSAREYIKVYRSIL